MKRWNKVSLTRLGLLVFGLAALAGGFRPGLAQQSGQRVYLPVVANASSPAPGNDWLSYYNFYRASANVPAVVENAEWSAGNVKHAIYIVKNGALMHDETPSNAWYTPEGRNAAKNSNLYASSTTHTSDKEAIDAWMQGPFHAAGMIDPRITQVGFGSYREAGGAYQMAAGINILGDLADHYFSPAAYPVIWPADGKNVPVGVYDGSEYPDPLTSCPGYSVPSGLPVLMLMGNGSTIPNVTAIAFAKDGQAVPACVFDETSYTNPDSGAQSLARQVLHMRNAVVLIPRDPLTSGHTYTASITANGQIHTWSFSVSP